MFDQPVRPRSVGAILPSGFAERTPVVCVLAMRWYGEGSLEAQGSAWYAKVEPTFSDCLALARRRIWGSRRKSGSTPAGDPLQWTEPLWEAMIHGLSRAA